jgi:hypothetical protein
MVYYHTLFQTISTPIIFLELGKSTPTIELHEPVRFTTLAVSPKLRNLSQTPIEKINTFILGLTECAIRKHM